MFTPIGGSGQLWLDPRSLWWFRVIGTVRRTSTTDRHIIIQGALLITVLVMVPVAMTNTAGLSSAVVLVAGTGYVVREVLGRLARTGDSRSGPRELWFPVLRG